MSDSSMQARHPVKQFVASWILGGTATAVVLGVITGVTLGRNGWWGYLRLVNGGATTQAAVTRTDRGNHCLAQYEFAVAGQNYSGSGPDCTAQVGQSVNVTFLLSDPGYSCLGRARDRL